MLETLSSQDEKVHSSHTCPVENEERGVGARNRVAEERETERQTQWLRSLKS